MSIITSLLAFLLAVAILVPFHEFGHFWVARRCGVKVLRFAVGFGKVLWSYRARDGVEYCLCAIPLGGYVKMLDEREGEVAEGDLPYAFNRQNVWKRFVIVLAGPVFNLILAVLLLFGVFKIGFEAPIPLLGAISTDSVIYQSGLRPEDELMAIDGHPTPTVDNVQQVLMVSEGKPSVDVLVLRDTKPQTIVLQQPLNAMKEITFSWPAELGAISPDSPAMQAGLNRGDTVVKINQQPIESWENLIKTISEHPKQMLAFDILREGKHIQLTVTPSTRPDGTGMIGAHFPEAYMRKGALGWQISAQEAVKQTYSMAVLNLKLFAQMATGRASFDNIGGPVTIAYAAGVSAERGAVTYLYFLSMISIGLAVLNLLPIPMLDGGHLLFYLVEIVLRRPLSERAQEIALRVGIIILISLMLVALFNDMMRWV